MVWWRRQVRPVLLVSFLVSLDDLGGRRTVDVEEGEEG